MAEMSLTEPPVVTKPQVLLQEKFNRYLFV